MYQPIPLKEAYKAIAFYLLVSDPLTGAKHYALAHEEGNMNIEENEYMLCLKARVFLLKKYGKRQHYAIFGETHTGEVKLISSHGYYTPDIPLHENPTKVLIAA